MGKRTIIWTLVILLVLIAPAIQAVDLNDQLISAWLTGTNHSGAIAQDVVSDINGTKVGSGTIPTVKGANPTGSSGQYASKFFGSTTSDTNYFKTANYGKASLTSFSICWTAKAFVAVNNNAFFQWSSGANDNIHVMDNYGGNGKMFNFIADIDGSNNPTKQGSIARDNSWHSYCISCNSTENVAMYLDGKLKDTQAITGACANVGALPIEIGAAVASAEYFNGTIQDIYFYNKTVAGTQALQLNFSNGDTAFYPFTAPAPPVVNSSTFINQTPANNTQYSSTTRPFSLYINYSGDDAQSTNCSLIVNSVVEYTQAQTGNGTLYYNTVKTLTTGTKNYNWSCSNELTSVNSPTYIFYIDTADPTITHNFINNSLYFNKNLTAQFNFTDDQAIFSFNISIDKGMIANKSEIGSTFYSYNLSAAVTSLSIGEHTLTVRLADGHTAQEIGVYEVTDGSTLRFEDNGDDITIKEKSLDYQDEYTAKKLIDRYTWTYEPNTIKSSYTFVVESSNHINIMDVPKTPYKKWLVSGNKWIDFYIPNENPEIKLTRVSSKKIEVTLSNIKNPELISFNSIGELNVIELNLTFYKATASTNYTKMILEAQPLNHMLFLDGSGISALSNLRAELFWNGSSRGNGTKTTINATRVRFNVSFSTPAITTLNTTKYFNWTVELNNSFDYIPMDNQTIFQARIDNCTNYHTQSLNFTPLLFPAKTPLFADIDFFAIFRNTYGYQRNITITVDDTNSSKWCIYPNWATIKTDFFISTYTYTGLAEFSYNTVNTTMNNVTRDFILYLVNGTTQITYTVVDQNDDPVENVLIHVLQFNTETGQYEEVQAVKTDYLGVAIGHAVLNTEWYKFILTRGSDIVLSTSATKLVAAARTFRIDTSDFIFMDRFTDIRGMFSNLIFNNASNRFEFTYSDPSASIGGACLKVIRRSGAGDTLINETCLNTASGTIMSGIGGGTGQRTYIATGYAHYDEQFTLRTLSITLGRIFQNLGIEGAGIGFMLILTMACIAIFSPVLAVVLTGVSFIFTNMIGLLYLDWPYLILVILLAGLTIYKLNRGPK